MSARRLIIDDQRYCHFVTFSCDRRRKYLNCEATRQIVIDQLAAQLQRQSARCIGFVVMPDHVHCLIWFPVIQQLSRFMQSWKRLSSYSIRKWFSQPRVDGRQESRSRIWTPRYYAFQIYSERKLEEKLDYIHQNPVRADLVERAADWPWSSARWYLRGERVGVPITCLD